MDSSSNAKPAAAAAVPATDPALRRDVHESWICPITSEIMLDPVIGPDGYTYERAAITRWLASHGTSPLTRTHMHTHTLTPNRALKATIDAYLDAHPDVKAEVLAAHGAAAAVAAPAAPPGAAAAAAAPETASVPPDRAFVSVSGMTIGSESAGVHGAELGVDAAPHGIVSVRVAARTRGSSASAGPINQLHRHPAAVVCVLDTSGSMGESAAAPRAGAAEEALFSRLDLVRHCVRTITHTLAPADSISIVEFSDSASVVLPMTNMDAEGKSIAASRLDALKPTNSTNLWDGLRLGLEIATQHTESHPHVHTVVLLLTDGESNINPPRGVMPTFTRYVAEHGSKVAVHTVGFGYRLDTPLLAKIADHAGGSYAYIPDCSMVGTVFINFLSSLLACAARGMHVRVTPPEDGSVRILGQAGLEFNAGAIQYDQERSIVLEYTAPPTPAEGKKQPTARVSLSIEGETLDLDIKLVPSSSPNIRELTYDWARASLVAALQAAMAEAGNTEAAQRCMTNFATWLAARQASCPDERLEAMLSDLTGKTDSTGQIGKAFSRADWMNKWGKHYIPSVIRAHALQVCVNFKDAGMQHYGGPAFRTFQNEAEALFCNLPAPKPSRAPEVPRGRSTYSPPPVSMDMFLNASGGCIHGDAPVRLASGVSRLMQDLRAGDQVVVDPATGRAARVQCIVRTRLPMGVAALCRVAPSLLLTPWHPVRVDNEWKFPADIARMQLVTSAFVYNVVLEDGAGSMIVDGMEVVTLGHGITGDPVAEHAYLGTNKVLDDLRAMRGWTSGCIDLHATRVERDAATGRICRWHEAPLAGADDVEHDMRAQVAGGYSADVGVDVLPRLPHGVDVA